MTFLTEAEINELIETRLIEAQDDCKEVRARLLAIDDCRDNPCQNGQCIDLENDYRCECQPGYGGKNCDQNCPVDNPLYRVIDGVCFRLNNFKFYLMLNP